MTGYPYKVENVDTDNKWRAWTANAATESEAIAVAKAESAVCQKLGYTDRETRFVAISRESGEVIFDTHMEVQ